MKINISTFILSALMGLLVFSCSDDKENFSGPYNIVITGSGSVRPETSEEYTIGDFSNPDSYSWTVEGDASIVGSSTGRSIEVQFNAVGDVTISVTNGSDENGHMNIEVADTEPAVTATLNGTGVLKSGDTDTVFFKFDAPFDGNPTFAMNSDSSGFVDDFAFTSGSLGAFMPVEPDSGYALYTAGAGNGTPEALFQDIKSTSAYGGVNIDSAFVWLYRVDNIAPVASLSYSSSWVNDSTIVTVTATFSEPIMSTVPTDSAWLISFSGAGVMAQTDTLEATDDPTVYTYDYTLNGDGNGTVDVSLSNILDWAGHPLAGVNNTSMIQVDNVDPVIVAMDAAAGDPGTAMVKLTSSENGTGWYLILADGADAPTLDDFEGADWLDLSALVESSESVSMSAGDYDVYFVVGDGAGNFSDVSAAVNLTVN